MFSEGNKIEPVGIRTNLRRIATAEGEQAALTTAYRWQSALEELRDVACPFMFSIRPGGPQLLCVAILLKAVNDYIAENPLAAPPVEVSEPKVEQHSEPPCPDDLGEGV